MGDRQGAVAVVRWGTVVALTGGTAGRGRGVRGVRVCLEVVD